MSRLGACRGCESAIRPDQSENEARPWFVHTPTGEQRFGTRPRWRDRLRGSVPGESLAGNRQPPVGRFRTPLIELITQSRKALTASLPETTGSFPRVWPEAPGRWASPGSGGGARLPRSASGAGTTLGSAGQSTTNTPSPSRSDKCDISSPLVVTEAARNPGRARKPGVGKPTANTVRAVPPDPIDPSSARTPTCCVSDLRGIWPGSANRRRRWLPAAASSPRIPRPKSS